MLSPQEAAWYLAGIIDGEGHVCTSVRSRCLQIANTDPSIILATQDCLDVLGIEYTTRDYYPDGCKEYWRIEVHRFYELVKIAKLVPVRSEKKKAALQEIANYPTRCWADDDPRIDLIRELYWQHGMSVRKIAGQLRTSKRRIENEMRKHAIPTRDKSSAAKEALANA